jgi:hypothetical protein
VLASLATGIVSASGGVKGSLADLNNTSTSPVYAALNSFLTGSDPNPSGKPKAYLKLDPAGRAAQICQQLSPERGHRGRCSRYAE